MDELGRRSLLGWRWVVDRFGFSRERRAERRDLDQQARETQADKSPATDGQAEARPSWWRRLGRGRSREEAPALATDPGFGDDGETDIPWEVPARTPSAKRPEAAYTARMAQEPRVDVTPPRRRAESRRRPPPTRRPRGPARRARSRVCRRLRCPPSFASRRGVTPRAAMPPRRPSRRVGRRRSRSRCCPMTTRWCRPGRGRRCGPSVTTRRTQTPPVKRPPRPRTPPRRSTRRPWRGPPRGPRRTRLRATPGGTSRGSPTGRATMTSSTRRTRSRLSRSGPRRMTRLPRRPATPRRRRRRPAASRPRRR